MDLHEKLGDGWTLVGGQMVHLHCAEASHAPTRPTNDIDTVIDVRARPNMLQIFTQVLVGLGFRASGISAEGIQHRWVRGQATIDVLLPDGVGEKAALRTGVTASPTLPTPDGTQALDRSESVLVSVEGREGSVRRPTLVGALVMKAAAHSAVGDPAKGRHRSDFLTLASLIAARDFREVELTKKDRRRLADMIAAVRADAQLMTGAEDSANTLSRLERASA
ncbi:hypothetical protein [Kineosporia sp. NBRC 101677]|uniref:hypothetical protein n=2 Tax=Kineosporia TaxID=49184 RepID=UPI002555A9BE|nr:hypothetical protein [Kineosporia sp. NBRC 101677]